MHTKRKQEARKYPQSEGNLALADNALGTLQEPKSRPALPELRLVQNVQDEAFDIDTIAPATGIITGVGLSMLLWSLVFLVIFLIH